jgi:hypothetical protein
MAEFSRHEDFAPYAGKAFSFPEQAVTLVLAEIKTMPRSSAPGAERIPFSLIFHGPVCCRKACIRRRSKPGRRSICMSCPSTRRPLAGRTIRRFSTEGGAQE